MTIETLINKISEKSKAENVDLKIASAMVREDIRAAGELTPEIDEKLNKADKFYHQLMYNSEVQEKFLKERFEKLSYDEWIAQMKNPIPAEIKSKKAESGE